MAAGALGRAYIEVHADTKPFAKDLEKQLKPTLDGAQRQMDAAGKAHGQKYQQSFRGQVWTGFQKIFAGLKGYAAKHRVTVGVNTNHKVLAALASGISNLGTKALGLAANIGSLVQTLGSGLLGLLGKIDPKIAAIVIAIAGLVASIVLIAAGIKDIIGLLALGPGLLAIIAATLIPILLAFHGIGDALGAALGSDAKKFEESIKGLAPAAQDFMRELRGIGGFLKDLQRVSQQGFFAPLVGSLNQIKAALGSGLISGFETITRAAGGFIRQIINAFTGSGSGEVLQKFLYGVAGIITTLSGPVTSLLEAFAAMAVTAVPFIKSWAKEFGGTIQRFADFLKESVESGKFQQWLDDGKETLGLITDLLGAFWDLAKVVLEDLNEDGKTFLEDITATIEYLAEFFASEKGKEALQGLVILAEAFALALLGASVVALGLLWILEKIVEGMRWVGEHTGLLDPKAPRPVSERTSSSRLGSSRRPKGPDSPNHGAFANGGIVTKRTLSMLGEGDKPEVVIPLTNPGRAQQLMNQTGLSRMGGDVYVYIGNEQLDGRTYQVASAALNRQATALANGPRDGV